MHEPRLLCACQGAEREFDRAEPGELKRTTFGQAICWSAPVQFGGSVTPISVFLV